MSQVSYGTITITDTNDIESIAIEYNKNQSNQNPPSEGDSNWSTNRPTWQQGYYIYKGTFGVIKGGVYIDLYDADKT